MAGLSTSPASIVLVHGGFVDGAGWEGVYNLLKKDGYAVSIVQNPTTSLADDVAVTRLAIAQAQGPVVLVGHSYGGAVITEAGTDPKVAGLVYVTAFAPDKGESVDTLIKSAPPGAPVPPILPPQNGFLFLDRAKFRELVRRRCRRSQGRVPRRLAGAVGRCRARRCHQRAGLEDQAELVSDCDRRQDDPAARSAPNGGARRRDGRGSGGQPCDLCFQAGNRGRADFKSSEECELGKGSVSCETPAKSRRSTRAAKSVGLTLGRRTFSI